jgi:hypothetical protein
MSNWVSHCSAREATEKITKLAREDVKLERKERRGE